ncbi:MAG: acetyl-CoA carboxylase biotin carboxyl carrier protein [Candidatus Melainabacteria bacterium]|nr:acetyl-CoA carboxylase biotin carboxyl carrier protein [Candidatus Melainabacteria bacterium]
MTSHLDLSLDQVRSLVDLAVERQLAELLVQDGERRVLIKLPSAFPAAAAAVGTTFSVAAGVTPPAQTERGETALSSGSAADGGLGSSVPEAAAAETAHTVTAPMVGTFYRSPSPDSPPYVEVGQRVAPGQTLCILEAMKQMNELESEVSGTVLAVFANNGDAIEFGQPLFKISLT